MSNEERKKVLERVASGDLSPEEASEILDALKQRSEAPPATDETPVTSVRVIGTFRTLRIQGDPAVRTAVADGAHRVRTEDGKMIFEEDPEGPEGDYMLFGPPPRGRRGRRGIHIHADFGGGRRFRFDTPLNIRMNPDLPLEIDMAAGTAHIRDIRSPIKATLNAGTARFEGVRSPFKAFVDAGAIHVRGLFDKGDSEIRCTAGKVKIDLERGSSVRITARSTLGKIVLPHGERWQGIGGGEKEVTVGSGAGTLDLEATTGALVVESEE